MSDFGTMVHVKRRDGQGMTDKERTRLDRAIRSVQAASPPQDAVGEPLRFRVVWNDRADGSQDAAIVLSEYWLEGVDEGEYGLSVSEILEADRPKAQAIREKFAAELGPEYDLELICSPW